MPTSPAPGTAAGKPGDRPIGEYDAARSKRAMAQPVLSAANKAAMKAPVDSALSTVRGLVKGAQDAGRSFAASTRYGIGRLRSGRR